MMDKIELNEAQLIRLYNLLLPKIQQYIDNEQLQPDLAIILGEVNAALQRLSGEATWFACSGEDCDQRPFRLTAAELADAEGVICCEYCGRLCRRVPEEALQRSFLT